MQALTVWSQPCFSNKTNIMYPETKEMTPQKHKQWVSLGGRTWFPFSFCGCIFCVCSRMNMSNFYNGEKTSQCHFWEKEVLEAGFTFPPPGFHNALLPRRVPRRSWWVDGSSSRPSAPLGRWAPPTTVRDTPILWDPGACSEVPAFSGPFAKSKISCQKWYTASWKTVDDSFKWNRAEYTITKNVTAQTVHSVNIYWRSEKASQELCPHADETNNQSQTTSLFSNTIVKPKLPN